MAKGRRDTRRASYEVYAREVPRYACARSVRREAAVQKSEARAIARRACQRCAAVQRAS